MGSASGAGLAGSSGIAPPREQVQQQVQMQQHHSGIPLPRLHHHSLHHMGKSVLEKRNGSDGDLRGRLIERTDSGSSASGSHTGSVSGGTSAERAGRLLSPERRSKMVGRSGFVKG